MMETVGPKREPWIGWLTKRGRPLFRKSNSVGHRQPEGLLTPDFVVIRFQGTTIYGLLFSDAQNSNSLSSCALLNSGPVGHL